MTNPKGQVFQREVINYGRSRDVDIEGIPKAGARDQGDVLIRFRHTFLKVVAELKNVAKMDLSGWLQQADVESVNWASARAYAPDDVLPVVIHKRRGKGARGAYVTMDLETFFNILDRVGPDD